MIVKIQRRATRFLLNDYSYNSSVTNTVEKLQWDSLELKNLDYAATYVAMFYKSIFGPVAFLICDYVLPSEMLTTRGSHSYLLIKTYNQSFLPSTISIRNSLPKYVIESFTACSCLK